jgi:hypothetical protein
MENLIKTNQKRKNLKKEKKEDIKPEQEVKVYVTGISMSGKVENDNSNRSIEYDQSSTEKSES